MKKPVMKGGIYSSIAGVLMFLLTKISLTVPVIAAVGISVSSLENISRYFIFLGILLIITAKAFIKSK